MQDLDETIRTLKDNIAARERLRGLLGRAEGSLAKERTKLQTLRAKLKKEREDVSRLEGLTLTALFHTVLLSKTEQLQKERQEALRAKLRHDDCRAAVSLLEAETERPGGELAGFDDTDAELEEALAQKEEALQQSGGEHARRLFEIADERAAAQAKAEHIREALRDGERADESLDEITASLERAGSWGTWDMLGGGAVTTMMKHSHIDKSRTFVREAQEDLRQFASELEDVEFDAELDVEIGGFDRFADFFLDGLIFDWVVQSKIHRSRDAVLKVQDQVIAALRVLDASAARVKGRLAELEEERQSLIERL